MRVYAACTWPLEPWNANDAIEGYPLKGAQVLIELDVMSKRRFLKNRSVWSIRRIEWDLRTCYQI
jgi:hypothetical protein